MYVYVIFKHAYKQCKQLQELFLPNYLQHFTKENGCV